MDIGAFGRISSPECTVAGVVKCTVWEDFWCTMFKFISCNVFKVVSCTVREVFRCAVRCQERLSSMRIGDFVMFTVCEVVRGMVAGYQVL